MLRSAIPLVVTCVLGSVCGGSGTSHSVGQSNPSHPVSTNRQLPAELQSGVKVGAGFLAKRQVLSETRIDRVTHITFGDLDRVPGKEIGVAGNRGAVLLSADYRP